MSAPSERLEPTWDPRCGTMGTAGYRAHQYRGEAPCGPCSNARWAAAVVKRMRAEASSPRPSRDLPDEEWRDVAGTQHYRVSSAGRVRFTGSIVPAYRPPRDLTPYRKDTGYLAVHIGGENVHVHRLVAEAFQGNPRIYPLVRHLDGNPLNNAARNLAWGNQAMNMADARRHGTVPTALHGSAAMYNRARCRCDPCRAAQADRRRAHRAARRTQNDPREQAA